MMPPRQCPNFGTAPSADIMTLRDGAWHFASLLTGTGGGGGGREALEGGGGGGVPPLQGAQPMPSHCLPDGKCHLQWHNRQ